jgi:hypothetical protein
MIVRGVEKGRAFTRTFKNRTGSPEKWKGACLNTFLAKQIKHAQRDSDVRQFENGMVLGSRPPRSVRDLLFKQKVLYWCRYPLKKDLLVIIIYL